MDRAQLAVTARPARGMCLQIRTISVFRFRHDAT
jgi:hypothetical protein